MPPEKVIITITQLPLEGDDDSEPIVHKIEIEEDRPAKPIALEVTTAQILEDQKNNRKNYLDN